jgi:hypothetical protein
MPSVLGLDCSTKSIAFARFDNGKPDVWGELTINGANVFDRIYDAKQKVASLGLTADLVAIESAVFVNNMKASISLAYVYGAIIGELMNKNSRVVPIEPLKWQADIGNKLWTRAQKLELVKDYPSKPKTWYKQEVYRRRKQFTIDWVADTYDIMLDSDNVADSFGLARYLEVHGGRTV